MKRDLFDIFKDVQKEINFLISQTENIDYEKFASNDLLTRAVERSLEIIGEAVKNIPEDIRTLYPLIEWRDIAGMRDKLIHHYFGIDYEIVWSVLKNEIPELKQTIEFIIKQL
jgi:uncharacterized protein with HEPN domain